MEQEFKNFRQEVRADIELTQGLLRDTIKRQQKQEELFEQHALMLKQQAELVGSLMRHQLEGIQDFRKLEKSFGRLGRSLDGALEKVEQHWDSTATKAEVSALEERIRAVERRLDAA